MDISVPRWYRPPNRTRQLTGQAALVDQCSIKSLVSNMYRRATHRFLPPEDKKLDSETYVLITHQAQSVLVRSGLEISSRALQGRANKIRPLK